MALLHQDRARASPQATHAADAQQRGKSARATFSRTAKAKEASPTTTTSASMAWYPEHWHHDWKKQRTFRRPQKAVDIACIQELKWTGGN